MIRLRPLIYGMLLALTALGLGQCGDSDRATAPDDSGQRGDIGNLGQCGNIGDHMTPPAPDVALFTDARLQRVVWQALGCPQGPLTPDDVAALTSLSASYKSIRSL